MFDCQEDFWFLGPTYCRSCGVQLYTQGLNVLKIRQVSYKCSENSSSVPLSSYPSHPVVAFSNSIHDMRISCSEINQVSY